MFRTGSQVHTRRKRLRCAGFTVQGYFRGYVRASYAELASGCMQPVWFLSEQQFVLDVNPEPLNPANGGKPLNGYNVLALL